MRKTLAERRGAFPERSEAQPRSFPLSELRLSFSEFGMFGLRAGVMVMVVSVMVTACCERRASADQQQQGGDDELLHG